MDQTTYPKDPRVRGTYRWIEERIFREASRVLVTTPGTALLYRERYGPLADEKLTLIPNGFDPEAFPTEFRGDRTAREHRRAAAEPITLLHSGLLYPRERDPRPFFSALVRLKGDHPEVVRGVKVVFRATGHDRTYGDMLNQFGLTDMVSLRPPIPYDEAIREVLMADALLIFQAANCDRQIPAKAYECLYAGLPILGITTPSGDTGELLRSMGIDSVAALEDEDAIYRMLHEQLPRIRAGTASLPDADKVSHLSRQHGATELARVLSQITAARK